jgi:NAD(P)-dependent dehydrogenase (short-subunit alcohol dehydrogenase family)
MTRADDTPIPDYANMLRLEGRRYVILGAGQGIGRQAAHALAVNGAQLVCVDVEKARAEDVAQECGHEAIAWAGDISVRANVERLFSDVGDHFGGRLDGFIDIVGRAQYADIGELTDELWDALSQNLRHVARDAGRDAAARGEWPGRDDLRCLRLGHHVGPATSGMARRRRA